MEATFQPPDYLLDSSSHTEGVRKLFKGIRAGHGGIYSTITDVQGSQAG